MSTDLCYVVGIDDTVDSRALISEIRSAAARATKADPGDRVDIIRFETLSTRLEQIALAQPRQTFAAVPLPAAGSQSMLTGPDRTTWSEELGSAVLDAADAVVVAGRLPVLVVEPSYRGETADSKPETLNEPAARWDSEGEHGRRAVEVRFKAQIAEALQGGRQIRRVISPSGIQNPVVTEILREFTQAVDGQARADVDIEYRDGSRSAQRFALRSLELREQLPAASLELKFTLLSIRHTEMDAVVDGAWLRNAEISRPRPAALTDDLVYEISRQQLDELCRGEHHVRLYIYQSGLETAVVGFYKALTDHLIAHPKSVSVQPMFFEGSRRQLGPSLQSKPERKASGKITQRSSPTPTKSSVIAESALFRRGTPWTM